MSAATRLAVSTPDVDTSGPTSTAVVNVGNSELAGTCACTHGIDALPRRAPIMPCTQGIVKQVHDIGHP